MRLQLRFGLTGIFIEYRGCGDSHPRLLHISNNVLPTLNVYFPAPSVYKSCIHILRESFNLTKYSGRELLFFKKNEVDIQVFKNSLINILFNFTIM